MEDNLAKISRRKEYIRRKVAEYRSRNCPQEDSSSDEYSCNDDGTVGNYFQMIESDFYGGESTQNGMLDENVHIERESMEVVFNADEPSSIDLVDNTDDHYDEISPTDLVDSEDISFLYSSSEDSLWNGSDGETDGPGTLWDDLRKVVNKTSMNTVQTDNLLSILHKHAIPEKLCISLPKTERTLNAVTHENIQTKLVSNHSYFYIGLENQLQYHLSLYPSSIINSIETVQLIWNNDGLPIFKSCNESSWPILCSISNLEPQCVFPVLFTCGPGKPNNLDYLIEFVDEVHKLMKDGIIFHGKLIKVNLLCGICDAPARAMVKGIKQFNSRYGCCQCEQVGHYDGKRMCWPSGNSLVLRSDESFRNKTQSGHHREDVNSPFLKLDIDMINHFPPDFMHQGCGAFKRLLFWNLKGPKLSTTGKICKMSATCIKILNNRLKSIQQCIPNCFSRKARSTAEMAYYKMTEYRQLMLYTSKLVFLDIMPTEEHYEILLIFNVLCFLLVDQDLAAHLYELQTYLAEKFITNCENLYGVSFIAYNVHQILHFPSYAKLYGSLDKISAYQFENKLGSIKKYVRSSHPGITSLVKGYERQKAADRNTKLVKKNKKIYCKYPNNVYIDVKNHICHQVLEVNDEWAETISYPESESFFSHPIDSKKIGCYKINTTKYCYTKILLPEIYKFRRGIRVDLSLLEGLDSADSNNISVFMSLSHSQENELY